VTREVAVLGTASQVPTRHRNHNGYLLRFDDEVILFDPGEGTQRQMLMAGLAVSPITRICITHFHGDHSLGLPGILQRISLDKVPHPVAVHYPAQGQEFYDRLRHATSYWDNADIVPAPVAGAAFAAETSAGRLTALPLWHSLPTYGYRLTEPDGRRMVPALLAEHRIDGPAVGELQRAGRLGDVTLDQVSVVRPGQTGYLYRDVADAWVRRPFAAADHVLLPARPDVEAADAALAPRVTPELLADVVALVPDAWLVPGPEAPADLRGAYAALLHRRVEARAAWLPDLLAAAAEAAEHPPHRADDPLARLRRAREGQA